MKLNIFFLIYIFFPFCLFGQVQNITVDYNQVTGTIRSLQQVNGGPMARMYQYPDLTNQFLATGIDYVRLHDVLRGADSASIIRPWDIDHIFPNFSADPTLSSSYNFSDADSQVVAIVAAGAQPFIRLGYSWSNSIKYIPPSSQGKWAEICKHILMHYNNAWANGYQYNIRYVEIWNEPNFIDFWTGTPAEFYSLYDTTAKTLKVYDSNLMIGGPGTAGVNVAWLSNFLWYCQNNNTPLDFLSWHTYDNVTVLNPYVFYYNAGVAQQLLNTYGFSSQQIITEWATMITPSAYSYNAFGAAYNASALIHMQNSSVAMSFRFRSNSEDISGLKLGLWYPDGTYKKPAYTYSAFKTLLQSRVRLSCSGTDTLGYATIAGKSVTGDTITILISDVKSSNTGYTLTVNNLPPDSFALERYVLDSLNNLSLLETDNLVGSTISIQRSMQSPAVHLIRLVKNNITTSIESYPPSFKHIAIFPNPTGESFRLTVDNPLKHIYILEISNSIGQVIWQAEGIKSGIIIPAENWPSGTYFYTIYDKDYEEYYSGKIQKIK